MTLFKKQYFPIFFYGALSITIQLNFIKIISFVCSGNEISISIVLGHWLILTALGSFIYGKYHHKFSLNLFFVFLSYTTLSVLFYWFLYYLRHIMGIDNFVLLSNDTVFFISLLFLAVPVFMNGFMFPLITAAIYNRHKNIRINYVYGWELIGAALGSLLFALCLKYTESTYQYFIIVTIFAVPGMKTLSAGRGQWLLAAIFMILLGSTLIFESNISKGYYNKYELTAKSETPTGIITQLSQENNNSVYVDNIFIHSNENLSVNEEIVHFACSMHGSPRNLLIIGPANPLLLNEINKYKTIEHICHISSSKTLHKELFAQDTIVEYDFTINHIFDDPYKRIQRIHKDFDVILLTIPEPTNLKYNRYYTSEFFQIISQNMSPKSLLDIRLQGGETYLSGDRIKLLNVIQNTIKKNFPTLILIPGETIHFIGKNNDTDYDISSFTVVPGNTQYINSHYLRDRLSPFKIDFLMSNLEKFPTQKINSLFKPRGYFYSTLLQDLQTKGFISKIYRELVKIPVAYIYLIIFIFTIPLLFIKKEIKRLKYNMIFFGLFVMSQESILILLYQTIAGAVYLRTAVIIFLFMTGAGISSLFYNRFQLNLISIFVLCNLINTMTILILFFNHLVFLINLGILATGFVSGQVFPLLMKQYKQDKLITGTGKIYAYDILGGSLGLYLISILIIPVWGFLPALISIEIILLFLTIYNIIRST